MTRSANLAWTRGRKLGTFSHDLKRCDVILRGRPGKGPYRGARDHVALLKKRKLEKLLIADIDSAIARYDAVTSEERQPLIERLERTPSAGAKKLYGQHQLATKQREEAEKKLCDIGYGVTYNGKLTVKTAGGATKELAEFDDRAGEMRLSLAALKRAYVIKLFADHADTQSLFSSLAKELERLIG